MSEENDREYYEARAANARQMAAKAVDPHIGKIHAEMADRYDQLAEHAESSQGPTLNAIPD